MIKLETRTKKIIHIKYNEVAQNDPKNLHLHKKFIKLIILKGFLC